MQATTTTTKLTWKIWSWKKIKKPKEQNWCEKKQGIRRIRTIRTLKNFYYSIISPSSSSPSSSSSFKRTHPFIMRKKENQKKKKKKWTSKHIFSLLFNLRLTFSHKSLCMQSSARVLHYTFFYGENGVESQRILNTSELNIAPFKKNTLSIIKL